MNGATTEFFDSLAQVLLYCWVFGILLLVFWTGVFLLARRDPLLRDRFRQVVRDPVLLFSVGSDPVAAVMASVDCGTMPRGISRR
ncbi:MAG: hypothetical protein MUF25_28585 [Pirellulaceae bacterium]|nr:hypothetical protein [Pirellulaceae bacterium]